MPKLTVLIVDDQPDVVRGEKQGIAWDKLGIQYILTAYSVSEAEQILRKIPVDIMLCDIEMPPRSGLELLELIRHEKLATRCIFLSAHAEFSYAREAVRLGGFDYILQPAPYAEIEQAVARAIHDINEKETLAVQQTPSLNQDKLREEPQDPFARATAYIRENISRDLSRNEIAEALFLNPDYLSRLFKKASGMNLNEYIVRERMELAKTMLKETNIPVSLIAQRAGYSNFSYFSQVFRRQVGQSPLEYRQLFVDR